MSLLRVAIIMRQGIAAYWSRTSCANMRSSFANKFQIAQSGIISNAAVYKALLVKSIRIANHILSKRNHVRNVKVPLARGQVIHQLPHSQYKGAVLRVRLSQTPNQLDNRVNLQGKIAHQNSATRLQRHQNSPKYDVAIVVCGIARS